MNDIEKIRQLCKEKKIAISKLERDLGFGNGYINNVKPGKMPSDRVKAIADYLGVKVIDIIGGDEFKYTDPEGMVYREKRNDYETRLLRYALMLAELPPDRRDFVYEVIEAQYNNYVFNRKTDTLYENDKSEE